jgi:hypothetical protein
MNVAVVCGANGNEVFGPVVFVVVIEVMHGKYFPLTTDDALLFMKGETG